MNALSQIFRKLLLLFRRNRFRGDLDEEMTFHRDQAERELIASGLAPEAAHRTARRAFGNPTVLREKSHGIVAFRMEAVVQDLQFALRQLRKNPGFGVMAIMILTLGIGVSVAMFAFVDAALIQPLPFFRPERLMAVDESSPVFPRSNLSRSDYEDWKRLNRSFSSLDVYTGTGFLLRTPSGSVPVPARRVSAGFFQTLGVQPLLGRDFLAGEDQPGRAKIAILPYGTWMKRFGGRPNVIGEAVSLSGDSYTIVGVLPRDFVFAPARDSEVFVPLLDLTPCETRRSCHNLDGIGRLRDGVTMQAARADLKSIAAQLERRYPDSNRSQGATVIPLAELIIGPVRPILLTLLGGSVLLLLIACVNIASLVLVHSEGRRREVAVRHAVGAARSRLVRQFVTEGLLLAGAAGVAGLFLAVWLITLLLKLVPNAMVLHLPFLDHVALNDHAAAFAVVVALLAAALLAATPALRLAAQHLPDGLADGGRGSAGRFWQRVGSNLVVVEIAVAVVLLTGAGLLGKSLYNLLHVELGFDPAHLAAVNVMLPDNVITNNTQALNLYGEIHRRLMALPGVESVGLTSDPPVQCNCDTDWIRIAGHAFHGEHNEVDERDVSPDYFATLKARLIRGRSFSQDETAQKPNVVIINQALARKYFPGEDPIGQKIGDLSLSAKSMRQIIGIVADVRESGLADNIWPAEYEDIDQGSDNYFSVLVRTAGDESALLPTIVNTLRSIDPRMGVYGEITMPNQIESSQAALLHRFSTWLVGGFAALALILELVGLYGVIAYSVSRRTREIGVRMALGAQRGTVYKMVMRHAGWLTALGIGIGLACSIGASLLMRNLLFGVAAWDVPTLAAVALVLAIAALTASFLPARRAASVNPTEALRTE